MRCTGSTLPLGTEHDAPGVAGRDLAVPRRVPRGVEDGDHDTEMVGGVLGRARSVRAS